MNIEFERVGAKEDDVGGEIRRKKLRVIEKRGCMVSRIRTPGWGAVINKVTVTIYIFSEMR